MSRHFFSQISKSVDIKQRNEKKKRTFRLEWVPVAKVERNSSKTLRSPPSLRSSLVFSVDNEDQSWPHGSLPPSLLILKKGGEKSSTTTTTASSKEVE